MSKSYSNTIPLFMESGARKKLVMRIVTDSKTPDEPKDPDASTIYQLYAHFASPEEVRVLREGFLKGGLGYGDAKKLLLEAIERELAEPSERYQGLLANRKEIDDILAEGARKARRVARATLDEVREAIGVGKSTRQGA